MMISVLLSLSVANPHRLNCDLSSLNSANVFTESSVVLMGAVPTDASFVTHDRGLATLTASEEVTLTLDGSVMTQGFVHASSGTFIVSGGTSRTDCAGTNVATYSNGFGSTFKWVAPSDLSSFTSVEITVIGGTGYGQLKRQRVTLAKAGSTTSVPTAAPVTAAPVTASTGVTTTWGGGATATTLLQQYTSSGATVLSLGTMTDYIVSWVLDEVASPPTVTFALEAKTTGWVAIGIAEAAGMKGADIMMGNVDGGSVRIGDYHAVANARPIADGCQDWTVLHGEESATSTLLIVRRSLVTGDSNDRSILLDSIKVTKIITAMGADGDDGGAMSSAAVYNMHPSQKRAKTTVNLRLGTAGSLASFKAAMESASGVTHFDLRVNTASAAVKTPGFDVTASISSNGYAIENVRTTYIDFTFPGSSGAAAWKTAHGTKHAVAFAALDDPTLRSKGRIHHFVLKASTSADCSGAFPIWIGAADGAYESLPDDVGLQLSTFNCLQLQVHYDNPALTAGILDSSGVRIYLVAIPRTHSAGVFQLGDPSVVQGGNVQFGGSTPAVEIPQGGSHFTYVCTAAQTIGWSVPSITVFASILHMHQSGAQMYTEVEGPNGVVKRPNSVEYFDFEHQDPTLLEAYVIEKGSKLTTRCYYDNTVGTNANPLTFGLGSEQEMCIDFLYYYPVTSGIEKCAPQTMPTVAAIDFSSDAGSRVFGTEAGTAADLTCTGGGTVTGSIPSSAPTMSPTNAPTTFTGSIPSSAPTMSPTNALTTSAPTQPAMTPTLPPTAVSNAVVVSKVSLTGVSISEFSDTTNAIRIAFLANIKARVAVAASCDASEVNIVIISVSTKTSTRRRRLLSTDGVAVQFSVSAPTVTTAALSSDLTTYLEDTSSHGFAGELPADSDGNAVQTEVIEAPAAQASGTPTDDKTAKGETGTIIIIIAAVGGVILVIVVAIVVVVAVIIAAKLKKNSAPMSKTTEGNIEMGSHAQFNNGV